MWPWHQGKELLQAVQGSTVTLQAFLRATSRHLVLPRGALLGCSANGKWLLGVLVLGEAAHRKWTQSTPQGCAHVSGTADGPYLWPVCLSFSLWKYLPINDTFSSTCFSTDTACRKQNLFPLTSLRVPEKCPALLWVMPFEMWCTDSWLLPLAKIFHLALECHTAGKPKFPLGGSRCFDL